MAERSIERYYWKWEISLEFYDTQYYARRKRICEKHSTKKREATVQKDFPLLFIFPISVLFLLLFLHDLNDEWVKNKS